MKDLSLATQWFITIYSCHRSMSFSCFDSLILRPFDPVPIHKYSPPFWIISLKLSMNRIFWIWHLYISSLFKFILLSRLHSWPIAPCQCFHSSLNCLLYSLAHYLYTYCFAYFGSYWRLTCFQSVPLRFAFLFLDTNIFALFIHIYSLGNPCCTPLSYSWKCAFFLVPCSIDFHLFKYGRQKMLIFLNKPFE